MASMRRLAEVLGLCPRGFLSNKNEMQRTVSHRYSGLSVPENGCKTGTGLKYKKGIILIFNQPIEKFDSYNAATRRQAPLPGGKPACGRFPRLAAFYLPPLSTERLKISIKRKRIKGKRVCISLLLLYHSICKLSSDFIICKYYL